MKSHLELSYVALFSYLRSLTYECKYYYHSSIICKLTEMCTYGFVSQKALFCSFMDRKISSAGAICVTGTSNTQVDGLYWVLYAK